MIICGAGPAGSTCALALAESGLNVAVIDKNTFPRDKTCGDLVAAYVPKVLNTLHPKFKDAFHSFEEKLPVDTCRLFAPNKKWIDFPFPESHFVSKRVDLDNFLYELASKEHNISYFLDHSINDISIDQLEGEVSVTCDGILFKAKLIIGCDGANGMSSKKLTSTTLDPKHHAGAIRAYYKNVEGTSPNTFELHFMKHLQGGYFWIFPLKNGIYNVGLGAETSQISKHKMNLRNELKNIIETFPEVKERFKNAEVIGNMDGFGLPLGSRKVAISGSHFMLCGDAASLIDPFTGEGIGQAMVSGRYAGWQAKKCFESADFSGTFMKQYDKMVYDKLWRNHRKSYAIKKLVNRSWLFNGVFNMAHSSGAFRRLIQKVVM